ncbi:hypothetical protein ACIBG7_27310 [Nonomuraea sp. NPDC050328]|uniref:hypothetical protein n=1 Tax=Nonomuraea sp. NPDC050328 TaxID=3364361 RepID=UPI0037B01955
MIYLSPRWEGVYKPVRAMTEGINGRLKGHDLDLGDPKDRLARGRVAQTILIALLVTVANDHFLDTRRRQHQPQREPDAPTDHPGQSAEPAVSEQLERESRPPPGP